MSNYIFRKSDSIGNLDAEYDDFLNECFYESEIYKVLVSFDGVGGDFLKRVVVGRTGSGKTALLKKVVENERVKGYGVIEAETTVFEHIANNVFISNLQSDGVDLRVFYKSLWIHVLLVKVIDTIYPERSAFMELVRGIGGSSKEYKMDLVREYVDSFRDEFFNDNVASEITNKMQEDLSGGAGAGIFNVSGKKTKENLETIQRTTAKYVSSELLRKQKEVISFLKSKHGEEKQQRLVITIDDLDKSWLSQSNIRYDFINALLDAFKEFIDIRSVKILISIRSDILMGVYRNNLRQEEKDRSLILPVEWQRAEVLKILDYRINYLIRNKYSGRENVCFSDVFYFDVLGEKSSDYILDRTMLRPRDAIDFVNLCLSEADGSTEMNESMLLLAEEKYYVSRKQALIKEWISIYSHVEDYLDSLVYMTRSSFRVSEISAENESVMSYLVERTNGQDDQFHSDICLNFESLLRVWFVFGVLGVKKSENLIVYSSFDKPSLDISDLNKEFVIHPLFFRQ